MLKNVFFILIMAVLISCGSEQQNAQETRVINQKSEVDTVKELLNLDENQILVAHFQTNMGNFDIELFAKDVPKTVENFVGLTTKNLYDGIIFHRVIADFMIQGGDPTGTGRGGESYFGKSFEDEFRMNLKHDQTGVLSMANAGPNTNGSQFFITLVPTPWLDGRHTVFGKVITGLDVVKAIGMVETSQSYMTKDRPLKDVVMEKVWVEKITK